ncbi:MAG: HAD family phosphatase [Candidatus Diapherotrites archaeon]
MISALIFDLDGVLADTPGVYFTLIRDFLKSKGFTYTEEQFSEQIGVPFRIKAASLNKKFGADIPYEEYQRAVKAKSLEIFGRSLKPAPGLLDLLKMLKKNSIRVAVATNNSEESTTKILNILGLRGSFEAVIHFGMVSKPKPEPDVYLAAAKALGLPAGECCAVEDTALGIKAAKAAGMRCIAIPSPLDLHGDFSIADAKVSKLSEINMKLLNRLGEN